MDFQFVSVKNTAWGKAWQVLWLASILCAFASLLDWVREIPFLLPGLALPFISGRHRKKILYGILGASLIYGMLRLESMGYLANRLFVLSEAVQSYEYDYFSVHVNHPGEAFMVLSLIFGSAVAFWENRANLVLTALLMAAIAYFGITPAAVWLVLLALAAGYGFSGQGSWMDKMLIAAAVLVIALFVTQLAPKPIAHISDFDEQLRDALSGNSVFYGHTPTPVSVPEPEKVPPPPESTQQPDRGIMDIAINVLFFLFSCIALFLLFIPAIIKDRAEKKRKANRAFLKATDNAAAIREMYQYTKKWRALDAQAERVDPNIESIWLEAAFSSHEMTDEQKETMRAFVRSTAEKIWNQADWKKRMEIQYKHAL